MLAPVSLRLGHRSGLTVPRTVIQYLAAASLPTGEGKRKSRERKILCFLSGLRRAIRESPLRNCYLFVAKVSSLPCIGRFVNRPYEIVICLLQRFHPCRVGAIHESPVTFCLRKAHSSIKAGKMTGWRLFLVTKKRESSSLMRFFSAPRSSFGVFLFKNLMTEAPSF